MSVHRYHSLPGSERSGLGVQVRPADVGWGPIRPTHRRVPYRHDGPDGEPESSSGRDQGRKDQCRTRPVSHWSLVLRGVLRLSNLDHWCVDTNQLGHVVSRASTLPPPCTVSPYLPTTRSVKTCGPHRTQQPRVFLGTTKFHLGEAVGVSGEDLPPILDLVSTFPSRLAPLPFCSPSWTWVSSLRTPTPVPTCPSVVGPGPTTTGAG